MEILAGQLLDLPGYEVIKVIGRYCLRLEVRQRKDISCPYCNSPKLHIKDKKIRNIRHNNNAQRKQILLIHTRKFKCLHCLRYFWEQFPGIDRYARTTNTFKKQIASAAFQGVTKKDIAKAYYIGEATAYRYFIDRLKRKAKEYEYATPVVMGIDEHFFTRKKGYATTICDLQHHRVYDVVLGRSEKSLEGYLLRLKGREKVKVVCIDMSASYKSIVKKYFPNAKIVTDRFHVIRVINHHFLKTWDLIDPEGRKNRGLLSLMRRHAENLSAEQKINLEKYFDKYPELKAIYEFKQNLCRLLSLKRQNHYNCRKMIPILLEYIEKLKSSLLEPLVTLGNTLEFWIEEVVRMWRFTKNNGITEGFHTKMEMLKRRAYGFRNFNNYRLWVKILCH